VLTESTEEENKRVNEVCRENNIGFISTEVWGIASHIFVDFGSEFTIFDEDGMPTVQNVVTGVANGYPTTITLDRN
jgi:hypothetical protein